MSVLDTFYILFKSDADKAADSLEKVDDAADNAERSLNRTDKSIKAAATSSGKLAAATSLADANAKRLAASFLNVAKAVAAPLVGLATAKGLWDVATGRAEAIRELDQFSSKLNSSISDVDAFQRAVIELGGEGGQALDSLVKLGEKVNEAFSDKDSGARKDFTQWGLAFKDAQGNALGATDAMLALAGSLETVSRAEALARIKKLGIEDAATIDMLLRGRKATLDFMNAQKDLGVVTERQAEVAWEYSLEMGRVGNALTSAGNRIAEALLPTITLVLKAFSDLVTWATNHEDIVVGFITAISTAITVWLLPSLARMAVGVLAATWPFVLMVAAIAAIGVAFALAYEDFKAWQSGQKSLLGNLLGDYESFVEKWKWLFDGLTWDWDAPVISFDPSVLEGNIKKVGDAWNVVAGTITDVIGGAVQGVINLVNGLINLVKGIPGQIQAAAAAAVASIPLLSGAPQAHAGDLARMLEAQAGVRGPYAQGNAPGWVKSGQDALAAAGNTPAGLGGSTTNTNVSVGTVNVQTQATDATGIAKAVKGALQSELRNTSAGFDDGVDR